MSEENEELELPDEEDYDSELVYGIELPKLPPDLQPLECIVILTGIDMETGNQTMTSLGSAGMTPWVAVGLMSVEIARLKMGYTMGATFMDDDDEDDEDE